MPEEFQKLEGLHVDVEEVIFMPHLNAPPERPHSFVYFLSIINDSSETVTILGRKWILKESGGETIVVEGTGVVGETPVIPPGERFSYNSYHVTKTTSVVTGSFFGKSRNGEGIRVEIPSFKLTVPAGA